PAQIWSAQATTVSTLRRSTTSKEAMERPGTHDQPGIGAEAVARVRAAYRSRSSLAAASYGGERGHPVLFGADRWADVAAGATGDRGARAYLREHRDALTLVECSDVAQAYDIDTEADLAHLE
ncbi:nucleotidyltransferase family protein, partial [Streptomyces sp. NPDC002530]